ncbi:hypothetical protein HHL16_24185 [Pseudoflavitalea sp. G-6-1-2]|uniref:hypothetical protein n=1 Tax=Pseudoflavitalea sp. G-6-1-2 TaxID=2728841 RepID=UPI001469C748|nr:hypothetical protein [Pseudoflavitalea sp. G-6-1-2]NML24002.1 hypothetical protein [Pseudoflavitalea sp. G-6-1-2]
MRPLLFWPLLLSGIIFSFSSCSSAKISKFSIHADNDLFRTTIHLLRADKNSTGENFRNLLRYNFRDAIAKSIKEGIDCSIECDHDTSEAFIVSKIKGVEKARAFFHSINSFVADGSEQNIIKVTLSHASVTPHDSLLLKVKFTPEYVPCISLSSADDETTFIPDSDIVGIRAKKMNSGTYEYTYRGLEFKDLFTSAKASDFCPCWSYNVGMEYRIYSEEELSKKGFFAGAKEYLSEMDTFFFDIKLTRFNELVGIISGLIVIFGSITAYRKARKKRRLER